MDHDIRLIEIPLIREILYILELARNDMDKSSVINRIKCSYFRICGDEEGDLAEYMLRGLDFESLSELDDDRLQEYSHQEMMVDIIEMIQEENRGLPKRSHIEVYIDYIAGLIEQYGIDGSIAEIYNRTQDYDLLHRDFVALDRFRELLDKLRRFGNIFGSEIPLGEFIDLLREYLEGKCIAKREGSDDGINILTPVMTRGHRFKILFFIGLSQGNYPNLRDDNFFFREKNHGELRAIGMDIKGYYERLDKESLIFATVIAACSHKLYLSYSENATGDEKDIPSIFLDELLRVIGGTEMEDKLNIIDVDMDYLFKDDPEQLTVEKEIPRYLLRRYGDGICETEYMKMHYEEGAEVFHRVNDNIISEVSRQGDGFNRYNGNIGDAHINTDIADIHANKLYSISYLEAYGRCPYAFLMNNILGVQEMERTLLDFTPLDRGIILHEVLKQYYHRYMERIRAHILGDMEFEIDRTYDYIEDRLKYHMDQRGFADGSRLWQMRIENNAHMTLDFIKADLDRLAKLEKKAIPIELEVDFGREEAFEIEVGDLRIPFVGKIDRIDRYVDEDKYILIDYKSSAYGDRKIGDMRAGISLQLPIYMLSQGDKNIVACMHGIISDGKFIVRLGDVEERHLMTRRNSGALTRDELEELLGDTRNIVGAYMHSIFQGDFSIDPRECSKHCIYRNICRYEPVMEVE
ncbi:MAG: hypothetical protein GX329_06580 [Tissierellia bacterium]|nr:hypothetical protein [Tissierellia bacterium]